MLLYSLTRYAELKKILLIDDDLKICDITQRYIVKAGYEVTLAHDGRQAERCLETQRFCLVIFDAMLPDTTGFDLLDNFRTGMYVRNADSSDRDTPAIMLTALGQTNNVLKGLRSGADDYITKPFDPNELLERIRVILKRAGVFSSSILEIGNVTVNLTSKTVICGNTALNLQRREFDLLAYLSRNKDHIFQRDELIGAVWGWDYDGGDRAVDICIKRLRTKLYGAGATIAIKTAWGIGYRLDEEK